MPILRAPSAVQNLIAAYALLAILLVAAPVVQAQAPARAEAPPPPRLEKLEEGELPAVTIPSRPTENQIQEKREDGRVTSVRVTSGGNTYTVVPNIVPESRANSGDWRASVNRPPQWQVHEFNTERRKEPDANAAATMPQPPAPPAAPAATRP
ncbi:MAG: hypothetical protein JWP36_1097 [Paucimonas sp.]|nr:hypothetical protein [Paucimonas sp.]